METKQNRKRYNPTPNGKATEITDNDIFGVFEPLTRFTYLTTKQIKARDKRYPSITGHRLGQLYHEGEGRLIRRLSQDFRLADHLRNDEFYTLGEDGEALLIVKDIIPPENWVRATKIGNAFGPPKYSLANLIHEHGCWDIMLDIELGAPNFKTHIQIIKDAPATTRKLTNPLRIPVHANDQLKKSYLVPDGLFAINDRYYALEFDTGSQSIETIIRHKILAYREIVAAGIIDDQFAIDNLTVLFVTTIEERIPYMMNMVASIAKNGRSSMFAFVTRPDLRDIFNVPPPNGKMYRLQYERVGFPPLQLGQK